MNEKQFKNFLNAWSADVEDAAYQKEAAVSFLKRLLRFKTVVKIADIKTPEGRQVTFIEKHSKVKFIFEVEGGKVSIYY